MGNCFEDWYKRGDVPWDVGKPEENLIRIVRDRKIQACKALEIGCGTGDNAIWLARSGFDVTGCDISKTAIELAQKKVLGENLRITFLVYDFLTEDIPGAPFGFVFDRGCFHSVEKHERDRFARQVFFHLGENGYWLSLIGSADTPPRDHGPPQLTSSEIVEVTEKYFEILLLEASSFTSKRRDGPKAWVCLMRKRTGMTKTGWDV